MTENTSNIDETELRRINELIGEAELKKDRSLIEPFVSPNLIFLRASGKVADLEGYLGSLTDAANTNDHLSWDVRQIEVTGDHALVVVNVMLRGKRGGNDIEGVFRNFRTFMKQGAQWQLVTWVNIQV